MRRMKAFRFCDVKIVMLSSGKSLFGTGTIEEQVVEEFEKEFKAASKAP